jgi:hypothetical protein
MLTCSNRHFELPLSLFFDHFGRKKSFLKKTKDKMSCSFEAREEEKGEIQLKRRRLLEEPIDKVEEKDEKEHTEERYVDKRDAQFDACNRLIRELATVATREEKLTLMRQRMSECFLIFVYVFHPALSFGPLHNADALDECEQYEIQATTAPQSLFQFFDLLQRASIDRSNNDDDDGEEEGKGMEEKDAARQVCAWLRDYSEHADLVRVILDRDQYGFHSLFGPLVSVYSLESNLRWYFENNTLEN